MEYLKRTEIWNDTTIRNILYDARYMGKMVSGKAERATVGSTQLKRIDKEHQVVVENTHEPITTQELFNRVQSSKTRPKIAAKE